MDWREARIGAGVNPGWVPLVDELHAKVLEIDPDVVVDQVKEKFGGLRYYFSTEKEGANKTLQDLAWEYETRSFHTCEVCGETEGTVNDSFGHGWVNTLCPTHAEQRRVQGTPAWQMAQEVSGQTGGAT